MTESSSINYLRDQLSFLEIVDCIIQEKDKIPCWDGEIYIYKNKNKAKDGIKRISIQVKGHKTNNFKEKVRFHLDKRDLKAYMNHDGIMFFLVHISKDNQRTRQIYYSPLLPLMIRNLIERKSNQKTFTISCKKFPDNEQERLNILLDFYDDSQRQKGLAISNLHISKNLNEFDSFSLFFRDNHSFNDFFFLPQAINGRSLTLYGNHKELKTLIPVSYLDDIKNSTFTSYKFINITVDNIKFYDRVKFSITSEKISIFIGACFIIDFINPQTSNNYEIHIHFQSKGSLHEQIKDLNFIQALKKHKKITINNNTFDAQQNIYNKIVEISHQTERNLKYFQDIQSLLKKLNIKKDFNICECNDQNKKQIKSLIDTILLGKTIKINSQEPVYVEKIDIANISIIILYIKKCSNEYFIYDFFDEYINNNCRFFNDENPRTSRFILCKDDFLNFDNACIKTIISDLSNIYKNKFNISHINRILLNFISLYDKTELAEALNAAKFLISQIKEYPNFVDKYIILLNELQIIKRERTFTIKEKHDLFKLCEDSDNQFIKLGALLLLEEQEEARKIFNNLNDKDRTYFKTLPIYKFYKI